MKCRFSTNAGKVASPAQAPKNSQVDRVGRARQPREVVVDQRGVLLVERVEPVEIEVGDLPTVAR